MIAISLKALGEILGLYCLRVMVRLYGVVVKNGKAWWQLPARAKIAV
jgi:hypothetical protein